jgi:hypothetical protein
MHKKESTISNFSSPQLNRSCRVENHSRSTQQLATSDEKLSSKYSALMEKPKTTLPNSSADFEKSSELTTRVQVGKFFQRQPVLSKNKQRSLFSRNS